MEDGVRLRWVCASGEGCVQVVRVCASGEGCVQVVRGVCKW